MFPLQCVVRLSENHETIAVSLITHLTSDCKLLTSIVLEGRGLINDEAVVLLTKNCLLLKVFKSYGSCLTNVSFFSLEKFSSKLEVLHVSGSSADMTNLGISAISEECLTLVDFLLEKTSGMESFSAFSPVKFDPVNIDMLALNFFRLQSLSLVGLLCVTDGVVLKSK